MLEIWNENYYIDLDKLDEFVQFTGESGETNIHVVKYETTKTLLDVIFTEDNEIDENLGMKTTELSIPFKLAFNTLLMKKIINKI